MARNHGPLVPEQDIAPRTGTRASSSAVDPALDGRFLDLDSEDLDSKESPFLRAPKRVPVRRGPLPKKAASRIKIAAILLGILVAIGGTAAALYNYAESSSRFRIESSDRIEVFGIDHVSKRQVMEVMGADIGRNVFFVPLDQRKQQLEQIPWVESASVARLMPNRLSVAIVERTPAAFVLVHNKIALIDAHGVVMEMPSSQASRYSFPVIVGTGDSEPLSTRAARMKIYGEVIKELDSGGVQQSKQLSEIDLSDPDDVKVTVSDPQGEVLVHLGANSFGDRFKIYKEHVQEWRQQVLKLASVDLRYDRQVIVNPDSANDQPAEKPKPSPQVVAKAKPAHKWVPKAAAKPPAAAKAKVPKPTAVKAKRKH